MVLQNQISPMINVTLFSQITQLLPKESFKKLVKEYGTDKYNKGINSWTHLISMLFCQLGQAGSVRDISNGLRSITGNLNHLGIQKSPSKSTLSYINSHRDFRLFQQFYFVLLDHLRKGHQFSKKGLPKLKRKVFLLDASIIPLCLSLFDWAKYRSSKGAVKLHMLLDYQGCLPVFARVTTGKVHEKKVAEHLSFPPGSLLVFDKAYIDYRWLFNLDSSKVRFVTRAKDNMEYKLVCPRPWDTKKHPQVRSDDEIKVSNYQSASKYPKKLRLVRYLDSKTGKTYEFLTNDFQLNAQTIADIYKERWHIEVFFKQIKQNLHIKSFVGTSENAVQIQIWTAMISMLLLTFLKEKAQYNWHLSNLATFIRLNLFVKIAMMNWLNKPFYTPVELKKSNQVLLFSG